MIEVKTCNHSAIHRRLSGYSFYEDANGREHPRHSLGYAYMTVSEARRLRATYPQWFAGDYPQMSMSDGWQHPPLIVTRHAGAVEWLRQNGIEGEVVAHVGDPEQVRGRVVYGALPFYLASIAAEVVAIDMPDMLPSQRGQDLTPEEMDTAGATLRRYVVREV